jgi:hypothetical protein
MDNTNAERQRRYIARLKAAAKNPNGGVTNATPCTACAKRDREIAALKKQAANEAIVRATLQERIAVLERKAKRAAARAARLG